VQHAVDRREWPFLALAESADTVELSKQLVRAIYQVNDHVAV
jgi:hypothetical protein